MQILNNSEEISKAGDGEIKCGFSNQHTSASPSPPKKASSAVGRAELVTTLRTIFLNDGEEFEGDNLQSNLRFLSGVVKGTTPGPALDLRFQRLLMSARDAKEIEVGAPPPSSGAISDDGSLVETSHPMDEEEEEGVCSQITTSSSTEGGGGEGGHPLGTFRQSGEEKKKNKKQSNNNKKKPTFFLGSEASSFGGEAADAEHEFSSTLAEQGTPFPPKKPLLPFEGGVTSRSGSVVRRKSFLPVGILRQSSVVGEQKLKVQELAREALFSRIPHVTTTKCPNCELLSDYGSIYTPRAPQRRSVHYKPFRRGGECYPITFGLQNESQVDEALWDVLVRQEIPEEMVDVPLDTFSQAIKGHFTTRVGVSPWAEAFYRKQRAEQRLIAQTAALTEAGQKRVMSLHAQLSQVKLTNTALIKTLNVTDPDDQRHKQENLLKNLRSALSKEEGDLTLLERQIREHNQERRSVLEKIAVHQEELRRSIGQLLELHQVSLHTTSSTISPAVAAAGAKYRRHLLQLVEDSSSGLQFRKRVYQAERSMKSLGPSGRSVSHRKSTLQLIAGLDHGPNGVDDEGPFQCPSCLLLNTTSPFCPLTGQSHMRIRTPPVPPRTPTPTAGNEHGSLRGGLLLLDADLLRAVDGYSSPPSARLSIDDALRSALLTPQEVGEDGTEGLSSMSTRRSTRGDGDEDLLLTTQSIIAPTEEEEGSRSFYDTMDVPGVALNLSTDDIPAEDNEKMLVTSRIGEEAEQAEEGTADGADLDGGGERFCGTAAKKKGRKKLGSGRKYHGSASLKKNKGNKKKQVVAANSQTQPTSPTEEADDDAGATDVNGEDAASSLPPVRGNSGSGVQLPGISVNHHHSSSSGGGGWRDANHLPAAVHLPPVADAPLTGSNALLKEHITEFLEACLEGNSTALRNCVRRFANLRQTHSTLGGTLAATLTHQEEQFMEWFDLVAPTLNLEALHLLEPPEEDDSVAATSVRCDDEASSEGREGTPSGVGKRGKKGGTRGGFRLKKATVVINAVHAIKTSSSSSTFAKSPPVPPRGGGMGGTGAISSTFPSSSLPKEKSTVGFGNNTGSSSAKATIIQLKKELRNLKYSFTKRPKARSTGANLDDNAFKALGSKISNFEKKEKTLRTKLKQIQSERRQVGKGLVAEGAEPTTE